MPDTNKAALDLLEQFRRERDELDILIRGLEKRLLIVPNTEEAQARNSTARPSMTASSVPVGFFHNMTQVDAAEKLLKLNPGHPLTTKELVDTFRRSGMSIHAKSAMTSLYTTLKRNPKFERVAGQAWGLSEWYPRKRKEQPEDVSSDSSDSE
jgi:HB1, ASXL, restriction endonuclease HTH domain